MKIYIYELSVYKIKLIKVFIKKNETVFKYKKILNTEKMLNISVGRTYGRTQYLIETDLLL